MNAFDFEYLNLLRKELMQWYDQDKIFFNIASHFKTQITVDIARYFNER